uniref:Tc1-like transposase DDE domain-containing protein n=1 Tax=Echeneis naucrates TaxID=173247 RepID=A0A665WZG1_ECHNA
MDQFAYVKILAKEDLPLKRLPARSPDLNPIENLWGDIKKSERCHKLVDAMPHRFLSL